MVKEQNQNVDKYEIPVWRKYTLSVQEAAKYFHKYPPERVGLGFENRQITV